MDRERVYTVDLVPFQDKVDHKQRQKNEHAQGYQIVMMQDWVCN